MPAELSKLSIFLYSKVAFPDGSADIPPFFIPSHFEITLTDALISLISLFDKYSLFAFSQILWIHALTSSRLIFSLGLCKLDTIVLYDTSTFVHSMPNASKIPLNTFSSFKTSISGTSFTQILSALRALAILAILCFPPQWTNKVSEYIPSNCLFFLSIIEYILQSESLSHNTTSLWNKLVIILEYFNNGSFHTELIFSFSKTEKLLESFSLVILIIFTLSGHTSKSPFIISSLCVDINACWLALNVLPIILPIILACGGCKKDSGSSIR